MTLQLQSFPRLGYGGGCADSGRRSTAISIAARQALPQYKKDRSRAGGDVRTAPWSPGPRAPRRKLRTAGPAVAMAAPASAPPSMSDYILDSLSSFLLSRGKELLGSYYPANRDPLDWLPPKLHAQLHRSEAFAITLVRESLVFGTLALIYCQVNNFCRWLHRISVATSRVRLVTVVADYEHSVFQAAAPPLRLLVTVWASTRLLRILARVTNMQQYVGVEMSVKARAVGLVVTTTWFFFRWKGIFIRSLIAQHKFDKPRIIAADRLASLLLYLVAATCAAEIVGFALRSLLAVGGISGLAVGLAAKEVVSNFFGGAVLFITRPFVIGERIKAGAVSGQVQDIGYLQTKVLGFDGVPLLVPNQAFINQVITNFSRANSKLLEASFYLHNQDIFLVTKITEEVVAYLRAHPQVETERATPMCFLKDMGHWGPEIGVMCTINFGGGSFFEIRQEIMVQVARIVVDVLGEEAPFSRNGGSNLLWELRMHLLYAGQGLKPGNT